MQTDAQPLSAEELAAIRERAEKATPGEWRTSAWEATEDGANVYTTDQVPDRVDRMIADNVWDEPDAEFIAHARTDIPRLLATIAAQAARVAELEAALADIAGSGPVNDRGEQDAYAGWSWCYERARTALSGQGQSGGG